MGRLGSACSGSSQGPVCQDQEQHRTPRRQEEGSLHPAPKAGEGRSLPQTIPSPTGVGGNEGVGVLRASRTPHLVSCDTRSRAAPGPLLPQVPSITKWTAPGDGPVEQTWPSLRANSGSPKAALQINTQTNLPSQLRGDGGGCKLSPKGLNRRQPVGWVRGGKQGDASCKGPETVTGGRTAGTPRDMAEPQWGGVTVEVEGVGQRQKCWGQQPSSPCPPTPPPDTPLTFMGMGGPQLHHGQVAGGGGAEGEIRGQGHRAPMGRGRGPHPAGHKAAQEGLACREKGGCQAATRPRRLAHHPWIPNCLSLPTSRSRH